ncbi:transcriptional antiterminator [Robertmurraya siralis]|uniref:Transcriptional antiterminator n=1 Tax=Robertmurraya siralis TaxID=77777 RepID=A0A920BVN8_9BACI|nr:PTS sugar transporter subunit IIA [Robertmurraya siralis]GIN64128.1 transcriptional antiterminator [Robertmurraya siralis]
MENKHKRMIEILLQSEKSVTSKELGYMLGVSQKTIRNYVAAINQPGERYIYSSHKGYTVNREKAQQLLHAQTKGLPENQSERVRYIIKRLLQNGSNKLDLNDISDELLVSFETVKNDFSIVKEKVAQNHLFITQKNIYVSIEGSEKDKRKLLSKLLSGEFNENLLNLEVLENIFPSFNLKFLAATIQDLCQEYHYFINDYALLNLILEVAIEIDRMKHNFMQSERHNLLSNFNAQELESINKLAKTIEEKFNIQYKNGEIKELANIVLSYLTKLDYSKISSKNLNQILDKRSLDLIRILKQQMKNWHLFDVEIEGFLVKFSLHIKNLLIRMDNDYILKNPLTNHIKHSCPLIFEHAIEIGNTIGKFMKKRITEDEITFLALHIGSIMGENSYLNSRIKCALFLPSYYDYSHNLIDKIKKEFKHDIVINQVTSNIKEIDTKSNDLLINIGSNFYNLPLIETQITPFLTRNDSSSIKRAIEKTKLLKKRNYLKEHLYQITESDLFFNETHFIDRNSVLKFMCKKLIDKGYVQKKYLDDVLDRESQSSTAFGKLAVPHSINMDASKTCVSMLISNRGIKWDEHNTVNVVLLFAIKKDERALFFNIFDSIVTKLIEPQNISNVSKSKNIDELIENFLDSL